LKIYHAEQSGPFRSFDEQVDFHRLKWLTIFMLVFNPLFVLGGIGLNAPGIVEDKAAMFLLGLYMYGWIFYLVYRWTKFLYHLIRPLPVEEEEPPAPKKEQPPQVVRPVKKIEKTKSLTEREIERMIQEMYNARQVRKQ